MTISKFIVCFTIGALAGCAASLVATINDWSLFAVLIPAIILSQLVINKVMKLDF